MSVLLCSGLCDAYWNPESIYLMRKPGLLEEILARPRVPDPLCRLGRAAILGHPRRRGLGSRTAKGKVLAKVGGGLGLPPGVATVVPRAAGEAVAPGSFDVSPRAWAATPSSNDRGAATVRVFSRPRTPLSRGPDCPFDAEALDSGFSIWQTHVMVRRRMRRMERKTLCSWSCGGTAGR